MGGCAPSQPLPHEPIPGIRSGHPLGERGPLPPNRSLLFGSDGAEPPNRRFQGESDVHPGGDREGKPDGVHAEAAAIPRPRDSPPTAVSRMIRSRGGLLQESARFADSNSRHTQGRVLCVSEAPPPGAKRCVEEGAAPSAPDTTERPAPRHRRLVLRHGQHAGVGREGGIPAGPSVDGITGSPRSGHPSSRTSPVVAG